MQYPACVDGIPDAITSSDVQTTFVPSRGCRVFHQQTNKLSGSAVTSLIHANTHINTWQQHRIIVGPLKHIRSTVIPGNIFLFVLEDS